jgi:hypothetical protein
VEEVVAVLVTLEVAVLVVIYQVHHWQYLKEHLILL